LSRTTLIIANDLKRRLRSPMATILFLVIPLAMTALIGAIFDPGEDHRTQLPPIKLLLVDHDKGLAAKFLLGAFDQQEIKDMFEVTLTDGEAGEKLMQKGKASALLLIPEHFSDDLAAQKPCALEVVKNPAEEFLPGVAEEFAATMAVGFSAIAQVFADELKVIQSVGRLSLESVSIADLTPFLERARVKIIALRSYLSPMLLTVRSETLKKPGRQDQPLGFNIFSYIFPGMLIMFLLFIIEPALREIQNERADGKTRRMMFSPLSGLELAAARIFSGWLLGMLVCLLSMAVGSLLFHIDWGNLLLQLPLVAVSCFWCSAFFAMLNAFFRSRNQAGAFASPIILVFSAFGGSMLPLEQLPGGMRWIGKLTVNNWFITGCTRIMDGKSPLLAIAVLAASGLTFAVVAMIALPRRLNA
jgi:ABC-type multidrug transport system permease subunit